MIQIIPSERRYTAEHGWLTSKHSFSFAEYYDPGNIRFGALRVFNDDIVQPGRGFGMHPHMDMEIVSYVVDGVLEHHDSMGNTGIVRAGEVQRITAGTGIEHAEYNHSDEEPVHFLQIWFIPERRGLTPSWEQKRFEPSEQLNRLLPVISRNAKDGALHIHQDVAVYLSTLEAGRELMHRQSGNRRMYLFVIKGELALNDEYSMKEGDTARISGWTELKIHSPAGSHFMLIDLA